MVGGLFFNLAKGKHNNSGWAINIVYCDRFHERPSLEPGSGTYFISWYRVDHFLIITSVVVGGQILNRAKGEKHSGWAIKTIYKKQSRGMLKRIPLVKRIPLDPRFK